MDTVRTIAAWVLFLAMAVVAAFFWHQSAQRGRHVAVLTETVDYMNERIVELNVDMVALKQRLDAVESKASAEPGDARAASPVAVPFSSEEALDMTFGDIFDALVDGESGAAVPFMGFFREMMSGAQGDQIIEASVGLGVTMQYQDFFNSLAPEHRDAVREIVSENMIHVARNAMKMLDPDADKDPAVAAMEAAETGMLEELRSVIGDEGVAAYQQYAEELPTRMLEQEVDMQLRMFARGLDEDAHAMIRHVLVEELLPYQPDTTASIPDPADMMDMTEHHRIAYDRALERLAPELDDQELKSVQDYIGQQLQMLEMAEAMMAPMFRRE